MEDIIPYTEEVYKIQNGTIERHPASTDEIDGVEVKYTDVTYVLRCADGVLWRDQIINVDGLIYKVESCMRRTDDVLRYVHYVKRV